MPRIPDEFSLGGLPSAQSGRPIATYDETSIGKGVSELGAGAARVGIALAREGDRNDDLDVARARANFLTKKIELDNEFAKDTGYTDLTKRYEDRLGKIREESASFVNNPRKREVFGLSVADDAARGVAHSVNLARKQEADANVADANTRLTKIRDAALRATDETERAKLIDAGAQILQGLTDKGYITREGMRSTWESWRQDYAKSWVGIQPPEKRLEYLGDAPKTDGQVLDRILGNEGTAKNPKSSAVGAGQFIDSTWLDIIKRNRPDLASGKTDDQILALRADKNLGRDMTEQYRKENIGYLQSKGVETTPANQYLAHFLGPAGAVAVAKADPNRSVTDVLAEAVGQKQAAAMVAANQSILGGKTVGTVQGWAGRKMGDGGAGSPAEFLPYDTRLALRQNAEKEIMQRNAAASTANAQGYERKIIDAAAGSGVLPARSAIENDPTLGEANRNALLSRYDSAAGDVVKLQAAIQKFSNPDGGSFNPFDKDDAKQIDKIYSALGGDMKALELVTNRTGIVPQAAVTTLRGALTSPDAKTVENALQVSSNLVGGKYPDVFANVTGGDDLTKTAMAFRHYVYDRGMTSEAATQKIMEERTPEYEQKIKARIKSEDVNQIVKKELKDSDIRHAFDDSWIPFNDPKLTFNPEMRQRAMGDYEEAFRENFAKSGDVTLSKKLSLEEMKRTWGVTTVNGSKTVMKYPPERSPIYNGIENVSEHIANQAIDAIHDLNGAKVDRSKLRIDEAKSTAERFVRGDPPAYVLSYEDKNGHVQTIPKQFYADPAAMRDKQTSERAAQSRKIQERVAVDADMADLSRANFGVR